MSVIGIVIAEFIRSAREIKIEKMHLYSKDKSDAMKRLISFATGLEDCLSPDDAPNLTEYERTFEDLYFNKIELDAGFHTKKMLEHLAKLHGIYGRINYYYELQEDISDIQRDISDGLYKETSSLRALAVKSLSEINL